MGGEVYWRRLYTSEFNVTEPCFNKMILCLKAQSSCWGSVFVCVCARTHARTRLVSCAWEIVHVSKSLLASFLHLLLTVKELLSSFSWNLVQTDTMITGSEKQTGRNRLERQTGRMEKWGLDGDSWHRDRQDGKTVARLDEEMKWRDAKNSQTKTLRFYFPLAVTWPHSNWSHVDLDMFLPSSEVRRNRKGFIETVSTHQPVRVHASFHLQWKWPDLYGRTALSVLDLHQMVNMCPPDSSNPRSKIVPYTNRKNFHIHSESL